MQIRILLLLFVFLSAPLPSFSQTKNPVDCAGVLTLQRAKRIVQAGPLRSNESLTKAIKYVLKQKYESVDKAVADLEVLLEAITVRSEGNWKCYPFSTREGTIGFYGPYGYALTVEPDGRIFKGRIDMDQFADGATIGRVDYDRMNLEGILTLIPPSPKK